MQKIKSLKTKQKTGVHVVVNTKNAAHALFKQCRNTNASDDVFHLSTHMCPAHRETILDTVRTRLAEGKPTLCVSTQLIEAGVDVDFGAVIRSFAGLDSMIQAAGRCNRHGRRSPLGAVHIVNLREADENLNRLSDIVDGQRSAERVLADYASNPGRYDDGPFGPQALKLFYAYYFFDRQGEMDYPLAKGNRDDHGATIDQADTLANLLSANSVAVSSAARSGRVVKSSLLNQAFMTAARHFKVIDAPTEGVVVPYKLDDQKIVSDDQKIVSDGQKIVAALRDAGRVKDAKLLRAAQRFTVNVFPHALCRLRESGAVADLSLEIRIQVLNDPRFYDSHIGLVTEPISEREAFYVGSAPQQH